MAWAEGYETFSFSTQPSMKFVHQENIEMPTIYTSLPLNRPQHRISAAIKY